MTTNARSVNSRNSIFARNPKITIFFVITISALILDVVLTNIFLYTETKNNDQLPGVKPSILGVRNEIYHHDLIKNVLNFESDNRNKPELLKLYCKLNKALYGLKQSPRLWYKHLLEALTKLGFEVLPYDEAIFIHNKLKIIIICHIDNLIFTGPNNNEISNIIKELTKTIKIEYISEIY